MDIVINLYKQRGITSNDALLQVKRTFKSRKTGHSGTLDPLAEGVLIIGLNNATKIFPYLSGLTKEYIFTAHLGITTDTYDQEGKIVEQRDAKHISEQMIRDILPSFLGEIRQRPPLFSAIKISGKPLYDYARKGIFVNINERTVKIHRIELLSFEYPFFTMIVECSTGTYIRSICHDIGQMLGVGAHITTLKRTRIGHFSINDSVSIEELLSSSKGIFTIEQSLSHIPSLRLTGEFINKARHGNPIKLNKKDCHIESNIFFKNTGYIRLLDERLKTFALGHIKGDLLRIKRVIET